MNYLKITAPCSKNASKQIAKKLQQRIFRNGRAGQI